MTLRLPTHADLVWSLDHAGKGARPWPVLIGLCLMLWLPGFFGLPPSDRDESRFAQASKQMVESGDLVDIRNGAVARNQKPIGIYWLQVPFATAARRLGIAQKNPIWPYRLPSLAGGITAVLATYGFGRRLIGRPAALLGAALLAGSVVLTVEVHMAKTDAALLGATTVAMGLLSRAWLDPAGMGRRAALTFWAALGVAILLKGPIAPIVCGLAIGWLAFVERRAGPPRWLWTLRPKSGVWLLAAIVLPWFVAIGFATHGKFFVQSVGGDLAGKLAGSDDAHGAPPGTHLLLLPLLLFAGGIAACGAAPAVWRDRRERPVRLLIAWVVPSWVVFEAVATKLPHYTMPLYPAVALLAARWMLAAPEPGRWAPRLACGVALGLAPLLGVGAAALPFVVQPGLHGSDWLGLPTLAVAIVMAAGMWRVWPDARRTAILMLCLAPVLYATVLGLELPRLRDLWIAPRVAAGLRAHWPQGQPQAAAFGELGFAEPSLMFLCGTRTQLLGSAAAAAQFLTAGVERVLLVDERNEPALDRELASLHVSVRPLSPIVGYNYSRGRMVRLLLVTAATGRP